MLDPVSIIVPGVLTRRRSPALRRVYPMDTTFSREVRVAGLRSLRPAALHRTGLETASLLTELFGRSVRLRRTEVTVVCPCCRQPRPSFEELIAAKVAKLRERCASLSIEIIDDEDGEFVHERDAATLLNISRQTLRMRRYGARPISFRKSGASPEYSLRSVAIDKLEVLESDVTATDEL